MLFCFLYHYWYFRTFLLSSFSFLQSEQSHTNFTRNFLLTKNFCNIQRHCVCIIKWNSSFNEIWAGHKHQNGNLHKSLEQTHEIKYIPLPQLKTKQCPEFAKNIFLTLSFNELVPNEIWAGHKYQNRSLYNSLEKENKVWYNPLQHYICTAVEM